MKGLPSFSPTSFQQLTRSSVGLPMLLAVRSRYLSKTEKSCLYEPSGCLIHRTIDSGLPARPKKSMAMVASTRRELISAISAMDLPTSSRCLSDQSGIS